jgi:hypothetical protein
MKAKSIKCENYMIEGKDIVYSFDFETITVTIPFKVEFSVDRLGNKNWIIKELYVKVNDESTNEMRLDTLATRLPSILVTDPSSQDAWDNAKYRATQIMQWFKSQLHANFHIEFPQNMDNN